MLWLVNSQKCQQAWAHFQRLLYYCALALSESFMNNLRKAGLRIKFCLTLEFLIFFLLKEVLHWDTMSSSPFLRTIQLHSLPYPLPRAWGYSKQSLPLLSSSAYFLNPSPLGAPTLQRFRVLKWTYVTMPALQGASAFEGLCSLGWKALLTNIFNTYVSTLCVRDTMISSRDRNEPTFLSSRNLVGKISLRSASLAMGAQPWGGHGYQRTKGLNGWFGQSRKVVHTEVRSSGVSATPGWLRSLMRCSWDLLAWGTRGQQTWGGLSDSPAARHLIQRELRGVISGDQQGH